VVVWKGKKEGGHYSKHGSKKQRLLTITTTTGGDDMPSKELHPSSKIGR